MPFFSIIIPTYNRLHTLPATIQTVMNQSFPDFEVLITDDGSTDGTAAWVQELHDNRIRYIQKANSGVCATRNYGAGYAHGVYLIFLDSDDAVSTTWLSDFFALATTSDSDVLRCGRIIKGKIPKTDYQGFLAGTFAVKKKVFDACGGYDIALKFGENTELYWRFCEAGVSFARVEKANVIYEIQQGGGGTNPENRIQFFYYVRKKHATYFRKDKQTAQLLHQVAGILCMRNQKVKEGLLLLWQGYFVRPFHLKSLLRAAWYSFTSFRFSRTSQTSKN